MFKIHKIPVFPNQVQYNLPHPSEIVAFCEDGTGQLCMWYKFFDSGDLKAGGLPTIHKVKEFRIFGTGHDIPEEYDFICTAVCGPYVWHLHELMVPKATVHSINEARL